MYCENCGNEYSPEENFCIKCGSPLGAASLESTVKPVNEMPEAKKKKDERWYHRLGVVAYVIAHLPLLIVLPIVWSENDTSYNSYSRSYTDTSGEAFWYCLLTLVIWVLVLRLIKMALKYVVRGTKPKFKDLIYF